jgi:hypothetical protein
MVVRQLEQSMAFPVRRAQMRLRLRLPDKGALPGVRQALAALAVRVRVRVRVRASVRVRVRG